MLDSLVDGLKCGKAVLMVVCLLCCAGPILIVVGIVFMSTNGQRSALVAAFDHRVATSWPATHQALQQTEVHSSLDGQMWTPLRPRVATVIEASDVPPTTAVESISFAAGIVVKREALEVDLQISIGPKGGSAAPHVRDDPTLGGNPIASSKAVLQSNSGEGEVDDLEDLEPEIAEEIGDVFRLRIPNLAVHQRESLTKLQCERCSDELCACTEAEYIQECSQRGGHCLRSPCRTSCEVMSRLASLCLIVTRVSIGWTRSEMAGCIHPYDGIGEYVVVRENTVDDIVVNVKVWAESDPTILLSTMTAGRQSFGPSQSSLRKIGVMLFLLGLLLFAVEIALIAGLCYLRRRAKAKKIAASTGTPSPTPQIVSQATHAPPPPTSMQMPPQTLSYAPSAATPPQAYTMSFDPNCGPPSLQYQQGPPSCGAIAYAGDPGVSLQYPPSQVSMQSQATYNQHQQQMYNYQQQGVYPQIYQYQ